MEGMEFVDLRFCLHRVADGADLLEDNFPLLWLVKFPPEVSGEIVARESDEVPSTDCRL
jgi:hypothetical protein